ncbi:GNAT family N-acetyltransferase [Aggregatimonas sangjinii]|uniref:GNAT family N-acetyltransferase n=1 Tax=Aggregatimonas sangjinii TaxID=2583587 RepID=A0A5B7SXU4_9FLAO|nr:GNAT family N-acetyltransferase [Aggregatimonas sangjinii]QCX01898.1 GNAT family N-acetyltransferase [Aggregatimonas sangjinii]
MLRTIVKNFAQLTLQELYALLQLRSEVFVVEQDCVYQDLDGKDAKALHILGYKKDELVAYTRIFAPGDYFEEASIGRVVVKASARQYGYGKDIMKASITAINDHYGKTDIHLSAQTYLKKFYQELGFNETGDDYLEDGIPHIGMFRKK